MAQSNHYTTFRKLFEDSLNKQLNILYSGIFAGPRFVVKNEMVELPIKFEKHIEEMKDTPYNSLPPEIHQDQERNRRVALKVLATDKPPPDKYYCPHCHSTDTLQALRKHIKEDHGETAAPASSKFWDIYKVRK